MAHEVLTASPNDTEEHYEFIPNCHNSNDEPCQTLDTTPPFTGFVRDSLRRVSSRRLQPRPKLTSIDSDDETPSIQEDVLNLTDKVGTIVSFAYVTGCLQGNNDNIVLNCFVFSFLIQIEALQEQVATLSHNQNTNDDRYVKVKQENQTLLSKVHALEEQLRDIELQAEEKRKYEDRRFKDAMVKFQQEKQSTAESHQEKLDSLQKELAKALEEPRKIQSTLEKVRSEKVKVEEELTSKINQIQLLEQQVENLTNANKQLQDELLANEKLVSILNQEVAELRLFSQRSNSFDSSSNISQIELKRVIDSLRTQNRSLQESNEELQAQLLSCRINQGRNLIHEGNIMTTCLADELVTLTEEQVSFSFIFHDSCNCN